MRAHPLEEKREEFIELVMLKIHEVVRAIEITAAMTAHTEVRAQAREARHAMDASDPWKYREGPDAPFNGSAARA